MDNQEQLETNPDKGIKKLMGKVGKADVRLKAATGSEDRKKAHKRLDDLKAQLAWQYLNAGEFENAGKIYDKLPKAAYSRALLRQGQDSHRDAEIR